MAPQGRCYLIDLLNKPLGGNSFCFNQVERKQKPKHSKRFFKQGKDKRRIGMIQNAPMFKSTEKNFEYG